jgi:uncharacterized protein (DUF924 family)/uncharacterized protein (DUF427 family)
LEVAEGLATAVSPDGRLLAASRSAVILRETDLPEVFYFPAANVEPSALEPTARKTWCPYKGEAAYDAVLGVPDKAWRYYDPFPAVADVAGHVAFYPDAAKAGTEALPPPAPEALAVLSFWFDEVPQKDRFKRLDALDDAIRERFGALHERAAAGQLHDWRASPDGTLALIVLLDQFSRNFFRDAAQAFAQDEAARDLADHAVSRGFDLSYAPERRGFCYMPFMHAEELAVQNRSVRLFEGRMPGSDHVSHARRHREEIHRHGRFRGRDAALGCG